MTDTKNKPRAPLAAASADDKERVAKVMARAGLCSRRDAEAWIKAGRVAVNGTTLESPAFNVGPDDTIAVDGQELVARQRTRLFLYHKPRGLVTTAKDPEGRATVFDNLPEELPRVVSVGRLDINTEGLLLLTNDGGLARVLELPSTGWLRRYRVRANGSIAQEKLDALRDGITIDGMDYAGIEAALDRQQGANVWITMGLREGKNREIKRVLEHLGLSVNRLIRVSFGPFQLGELGEGEADEVRTRVLKEQLGPALAEQAGVDWEDAITAEVVTQERRQREDAGRERSPAGGERPRKGHGGGPAAEPARPRQDRPAPRARPHVSALRAGRPETEAEPRKRISRAVTEDRKGRKVAVERVTVKDRDRHTGEGGTSRNARNFARERRVSLGLDDATRAVEPAKRPRAARGEARGGFGNERPQTGRALKDGKRSAGRRGAADGEARPPRTGEGRTGRPARTEESRPARGTASRPPRDPAGRPPRSSESRPSRSSEEGRPPRTPGGRGPRSAEGRPSRGDRAGPPRDGAGPPRTFESRPKPPGAPQGGRPKGGGGSRPRSRG